VRWQRIRPVSDNYVNTPVSHMLHRFDRQKDEVKCCLVYCWLQVVMVTSTSIQGEVLFAVLLVAGGNGYINEYPTGRILRDAKLYEIGAGTSEVRRLVIGRGINSEYK